MTISIEPRPQDSEACLKCGHAAVTMEKYTLCLNCGSRGPLPARLDIRHEPCGVALCPHCNDDAAGKG